MITRGRYRQKISRIRIAPNNKYVGQDPYLMKKTDFSTELKDLPAIEAVVIRNYLVLQTSFYSKRQGKAYKSI